MGGVGDCFAAEQCALALARHQQWISSLRSEFRSRLSAASEEDISWRSAEEYSFGEGSTDGQRGSVSEASGSYLTDHYLEFNDFEEPVCRSLTGFSLVDEPQPPASSTFQVPGSASTVQSEWVLDKP